MDNDVGTAVTGYSPEMFQISRFDTVGDTISLHTMRNSTTSRYTAHSNLTIAKYVTTQLLNQAATDATAPAQDTCRMG
jgi:hypothetical protein